MEYLPPKYNKDMEYTVNIGTKKRNLPICRVNDDLYIAAFDTLGDSEIIKESAECLYKEIDTYFDVIVAPEAKAIPLAMTLADIAKKPWIIARKNIKAYMQFPIEVTLTSITTNGKQNLYLDQNEVDKIANKRVLILDDVISTGESLRAVEKLVNLCGGDVVCKAAVLAEGSAAKRTDIKFLDYIPLFNNDLEIIE